MISLSGLEHAAGMLRGRVLLQELDLSAPRVPR